MAVLQQTVLEYFLNSLHGIYSKKQNVNDIDICINDVRIKRVYVTKFLGIQIDS